MNADLIWCADSYLMMDALKKDQEHLASQIQKFPTCVEVGTGSGILLTYLASLLGKGLYLGTDINPRAGIEDLARY